MSSDSPSKASASLHDTIITLPVLAIAALGLLIVAGLFFSMWAAMSGVSGLQAIAAPLIVVLTPLLFAVVAAVGVRRASVGQIDRLVSAFLDVTVRQRVELACADHAHQRYPFSRASLVRTSGGRSYVEFLLHWAELVGRPPALVGVKMNVFNVEVFAQLALQLPGATVAQVLETKFIDKTNLAQAADHAVLRHFFGTIQGSVAEGYEVRVSLSPPLKTSGPVTMQLSIRQKLREHFLASPYLKRYFAEDVAILIGVIHSEWIESGLAAWPAEAEGAQ